MEAGELQAGNGASVWWSWTAPDSGLTVIQFLRGTGLPGVLYVFTAEDVQGTSVRENGIAEVPFGVRAYTTFHAQAGETYQIGLFGSPVSSSEYAFSLAQNPVLPLIVEEPKTEVVVPGADALFTVASIADPSKSQTIQWQFNEVDLPGETFPMLVLAGVAREQAGEYRAIVSATDFSGAMVVRTSVVARLVIKDNLTRPTVSVARSSSKPGHLNINFSGEPGQAYTLEGSPDLTNWFIEGQPLVNSVFEKDVSTAVFRSFRVSYYEPANPQCFVNLRRIRFAQALWAANSGKRFGEPIQESDILPYFKTGLPSCPVGGPYSGGCINDSCAFGFVDVRPHCRIVNHVAP